MTGKSRHRPAVPGVTVFARGKSFAYYVDVAPDPVTGQRKREYGGRFKTEEAAWAAALKVKASVDEGRHIAPSKMTVAQFLREWQSTIGPTLKHSTQVNYADYIDAYVVPHIGDRLLQRVDRKTLNGLYELLLSNGRRKPDSNSVMYDFWRTRKLAGVEPPPREIAASCGVSIHAARSAVLRYRRGRIPQSKPSGLAVKTVRNVHRLLHRAFSDALAWGYRASNPAEHASLPRQPRRRRKTGTTWTADELNAWLMVAITDRDAAMWVLVATTGMRRSELAGAQRKLLDLEAGTLTKEDTWIIVDGKPEASDGKTESSNHTIALDPITIEYLTKHLTMIDEEAKEFGDSYQDHGRIFCTPDGHPLNPDTITRRFNRLTDRAGVPRIRLHDVRHTYATLALDNGEDLKVVSERLGHASMNVTAQIYTHRSTGRDADAASRVAKLIFKVTDEKP